MIIFCDPWLVDEVWRHRGEKPTVVVSMLFEQLESVRRWDTRIRECGLPDNRVLRDEHNFIAMGWGKPGIMAQAAKWNPFNTTHVAWIDIGVAHAVSEIDIDAFTPHTDKVKFHLLRCPEILTDLPDYYHSVWCLVAAGYIIGGCKEVIEFAKDFENEAEKVLAGGRVSIDEDLIASVITKNWDKYAYSYGDYVNLFVNSNQIKTGLGWILAKLYEAENAGAKIYVNNLKKELIRCYEAGNFTLDDDALINIGKKKLPEPNYIFSNSSICLNMIVKNEAQGIQKTLEAIKPYIDCWCILDTGSTDGTQNIIKNVMWDVAGRLYEEPFVDFSTSRNRAWDLAEQFNTAFIFILDADEIIVNGEELKNFCELVKNNTGPQNEAYLIERKEVTGGIHFFPRLFRAKMGWRYVGVVHEYPTKANIIPSIKVPKVCRNFQPPEQSAEATKKRWERDEKLLETEHKRNPDDPRTTFYLAQTYDCLNKKQEAMDMYLKRSKMNAWVEETYEALQRAAKCAETFKPWEEVEPMYLKAFSFATHRAEPLYYIANHYHGKDNHILAYLYAYQAASLPFPNDTMPIIEKDVYAWKAAEIASIHAYYINKHNEGRYFAEKVIEANPNSMHHRHNLAFYARSAQQLFGHFREKDIGFEAEYPYRISTPSVSMNGNKRSAVVRTVNYIIKNGWYYWPDGDTAIRTRNYWLDLDEQYNTKNRTEILDITDTPRTDFTVHGFEDCRLFYWNEKPYLSATICDLAKTAEGDGAREIALLHLDENHNVNKIEPIRGEWSKLHQKNWMPFINNNSLSWVYATKPLEIIDYGDTTVNLESGRLRGGAITRVPQGWLLLVHEMSYSGNATERIYLHRFVLVNDDLTKIIGATPQFYFENLGIEFAAGVILDGETIVASYSVKDASAKLGFFNLKDILGQIEELTHD